MKSTRRKKRTIHGSSLREQLRLVIRKDPPNLWKILYQDEFFRRSDASPMMVVPTLTGIAVASACYPQFTINSIFHLSEVFPASYKPGTSLKKNAKVIFLLGSSKESNFRSNIWFPEDCPEAFVKALRLWAKQINWPRNSRPSKSIQTKFRGIPKISTSKDIVTLNGSLHLAFYG